MTPGASALVIRSVTPADEPFLWRVLSFSADLPPTEPPPVDAVKQDAGLSPYLVGWGRPGDAGVIAEVAGEPVGAAWHRHFPAAQPGYGFVAERIPEISVGVEAAWRGRGIGRALLTALFDRARSEGIEALSLSVDANNAPAVALYQSMGFRSAGGTPGNPTMLLRLVG
ncbi:MAG TPA: GNAT family N-acetyltransferase [Candidatus Limnocylindria bacterium]|jgi:GNAT superfamily N-acetyltransferase